MTKGVVDEYLTDGHDPATPWTDTDVLACALAHSTRVAAEQAGWTVERVRKLRARAGHNRGRGHPSTAELEAEHPRLACACRLCVEWRSGEATRSTVRHSATRPKGVPQLGPWAAAAACATVHHDAFFPRARTGGYADPADTVQARTRAARSYKADTFARAKAVCARCPSRDACLDYALTNAIRFGVWGGTDWLERDRLLGHLPAEVAS